MTGQAQVRAVCFGVALLDAAFFAASFLADGFAAATFFFVAAFFLAMGWSFARNCPAEGPRRR